MHLCSKVVDQHGRVLDVSVEEHFIPWTKLSTFLNNRDLDLWQWVSASFGFTMWLHGYDTCAVPVDTR